MLLMANIISRLLAASGFQLCVKLQLNLLKGAFVRFNDRLTLNIIFIIVEIMETMVSIR